MGENPNLERGGGGKKKGGPNHQWGQHTYGMFYAGDIGVLKKLDKVRGNWKEESWKKGCLGPTKRLFGK